MSSLQEPKLSLVEVFRSLQGEGYNSGRDALFIRFAGCNLSCVFSQGAVCDTPYHRTSLKTSLPNLFGKIIPDLFPELLGRRRAAFSPKYSLPYPSSQVPMLVLTGGEPTLSPQFDRVVEWGASEGFYVAIETNGTRWKPGLAGADWISVSPKMEVLQGSTFVDHNPNPGSPLLDMRLIRYMDRTSESKGEYRFVIGPDSNTPQYRRAFRHYLSPATISDGSGTEWKTGFPGFVPGAMERCQEIIRQDPRWRLSTQDHKYWGLR